MKFKPLIEPEVVAQGFTHRLDFDVSDIPAGIANSTVLWNFAPLPNIWQYRYQSNRTPLVNGI
jgi:hypothetical protein